VCVLSEEVSGVFDVDGQLMEVVIWSVKEGDPVRGGEWFLSSEVERAPTDVR
jgi:hypothetical protein